MGHDVFISHSSKDKAAADAVCAALESNGIRCWIAPRDIKPGENWATSILHGITDCRMMVLVFSNYTNDSNHIRREVERAVHRGIPIAPIRVQDVMPRDDLEYFLSSSHWMDALSPPLEKHLSEFAAKVRGLLQIGAEPIRKPPDFAPAPARRNVELPALVPGRRRRIGVLALLLLAVLASLAALWIRRADLQRMFAGTPQPVPATGPLGPPPTSVPTPAVTEAEWHDLFNGKDTSGWNVITSLWKVQDRILIGTGGRGFLATNRADFTNFRLRVEAMISDQGNGGLWVRNGPGQPASGYAVQINANVPDQDKTGSLYVYGPSSLAAIVHLNESSVQVNQWFTMEVVADGFHITISVDGKKVVDYHDDERIASTGRIMLEVYDQQSVVRFRKVQIQESH